MAEVQAGGHPPGRLRHDGRLRTVSPTLQLEIMRIGRISSRATKSGLVDKDRRRRAGQSRRRVPPSQRQRRRMPLPASLAHLKRRISEKSRRRPKKGPSPGTTS